MKRFAWIYGGMAGGAFIAASQMSTRNGSDMNRYHFLALWMFAIALPMLVAAADVTREFPQNMSRAWEVTVRAAGAVGAGLFVGGTIMLFFSFNFGIGLAFLVTTLVMMMLVVFPRN